MQAAACSYAEWLSLYADANVKPWTAISPLFMNLFKFWVAMDRLPYKHPLIKELRELRLFWLQKSNILLYGYVINFTSSAVFIKDTFWTFWICVLFADLPAIQRHGFATSTWCVYSKNMNFVKIYQRPRSLISTFVARCWDSMICILAISKVAEQAGLNVTWPKIPEDTVSRDAAQMELENL